jgi:hypothetical protein
VREFVHGVGHLKVAVVGLPTFDRDDRHVVGTSGVVAIATGIIVAPALPPSSRQVPDLAGEAPCQGSARSGAEGREGRRPQCP